MDFEIREGRFVLTDTDAAALRATYADRLEAAGRFPALQFLVDELLTTPDYYSEWLCHLPAHSWQMSPEDYVNDVAKMGWISYCNPLESGPGTGLFRFREGVQAPVWMERVRNVRGALSSYWQGDMPEAQQLRWGGFPEEYLAALFVTSGDAPAEDYETMYSTGDMSDDSDWSTVEHHHYSPLAAEFVLRGGPFVERTIGQPSTPFGAVAHGVWYGRRHTWCDTPVSEWDSASCFSRTARGFLRLSRVCPNCEQFYRSQIAASGGLRSFVMLQRLDCPTPVRQDDLDLLDNVDVMLGDTPAPIPPP